ncbi:MAG: zinc ribbon domain-containing protein [Acidobacteria bacterium]|nr:zinc ribbon domain-containing protein [Acidobacteriota bacterium]
MSEFIAVMGSSGNEMTVCEHTTGRVLTGEPESVRGRLVYALESLGYTVVSDNPIQARRARRRNIFSADFLDHPRRLAVGLRQVGAAATQATFDFAVTHGGCATNGDVLTLEREADALVALAAAPPATGVCLSCGTENGGEARFCRLCGAPNASGAPAEVEVMRLTAGSRAGLQEIVCGVFIAVLSVTAMLPLILGSKPKAVNAGLILFVIGEIIGWAMALYGMLRIYHMLRAKPEGRTPQVLPAFNADAAGETARLPHAAASALPPGRFSVTDGTTELLTPAAREAERVPLRRKERSDTSPFA